MRSKLLPAGYAPILPLIILYICFHQPSKLALPPAFQAGNADSLSLSINDFVVNVSPFVFYTGTTLYQSTAF